LAIFSNEYFGYAGPDTAQVETGDFSEIFMQADPKYSVVTNSYGLMRAPWNNLANKRPTRYYGAGGESVTEIHSEYAVDSGGMSSCSNLYDFISAATTLYNFAFNAEGYIHGPIHLLTGGVAGTPDFEDFALNEVGVQSPWTEVAQFYMLLSRAAYRHKLLSCPESCVVGVDSEKDCGCTCDATAVIKNT
jgi:hypothetical protein